MKTAIVILNWNGQKLLEQFLPSVVNFSLDEATIYIADNASTDDSVSYVKTHFPSVKIIKNSQNGGYSKGYNDALKAIDADIYCLLNSGTGRVVFYSPGHRYGLFSAIVF